MVRMSVLAKAALAGQQTVRHAGNAVCLFFICNINNLRLSLDPGIHRLNQWHPNIQAHQELPDDMRPRYSIWLSMERKSKPWRRSLNSFRP